MGVKFGASREEILLISKIVDRAEDARLFPPGNRFVHMMDLEACHMNDCPLDLEAMAEGRLEDISHDIAGIYRNIDRCTGKLIDDRMFVPRFAITH